MKQIYFLLAVVCFVSVTTGRAQQKPADSAAKLISAPAYVMSREDEAIGANGTMKIAADVNKKGEVTDAFVYVAPEWPCSVDYNPRVNWMLRNAEKVVKTYKFSPAIKDGAPVGSRVVISMTVGKAAREKKVGQAEEIVNDPDTDAALQDLQAGVINGKALWLPLPNYPSEARKARVSGTVRVQVLIDEAGNVRSAQALSGPALLQLPARAAACDARFSPTTLDGIRVKVSGVITYDYKD